MKEIKFRFQNKFLKTTFIKKKNYVYKKKLVIIINLIHRFEERKYDEYVRWQRINTGLLCEQ